MKQARWLSWRSSK